MDGGSVVFRGSAVVPYLFRSGIRSGSAVHSWCFHSAFLAFSSGFDCGFDVGYFDFLDGSLEFNLSL